MSQDGLNLGSCCHCGQTNDVHSVILLDRRIPPEMRGLGGGWSCPECELPAEGAIAVLCDRCVEAGREPKQICIGPPEANIRLAIERVTEPFDHDPARHPGEIPVPGVCFACGCTNEDACIGDDGQPCHWVSASLCSACAAVMEIDDPLEIAKEAIRNDIAEVEERA